MVCLKHPDRDSVTVCAACGKPLCSECVLHADNADYCSESCQRKGAESRVRSAEVIRTSANVDRKARRRAFIWLIVLALAAVAGWYFYTQNQKKIQCKLDSVAETIKEGAGDAINAGKGAMPQDSKYKRERESLVR